VKQAGGSRSLIQIASKAGYRAGFFVGCTGARVEGCIRSDPARVCSVQAKREGFALPSPAWSLP